MKKTFLVVTILLGAFTFVACGGEIIVEVVGIGSEEGQVVIGLYDEQDSFPETGEELRGTKVEVNSTELTYSFEELPPGEYAVSLFHDENENDKLDRNMMGIPSEGYGFSNNAYNWYGGAPGFGQAKFVLESGETRRLEIEIKHWPPF